MRRHLFKINLALFLFVWLAITIYTFLALFQPSLPYPISFFAIFLVVLDLFGFPLIWLWYTTSAKTIQIQTAIATAAVVLIFYWGPFAPVYSMLSLRLDDLQLRWLAFAYIWEVVLVGALVVYAVLLTTRFADRFMSGRISRDSPPEFIHARIARTPIYAWCALVGVVFFGYVVGSLQLYYFSLLPIADVIKNLLNGVVAGIASAFITYFLLEDILQPVLQKSGRLLVLQSSKGHIKRFSIFTKIYATAGLLVLISLVFFGTMAYGRAQAMLEDQLSAHVSRELEIAGEHWGRGHTVSKESIMQFGTQGIFLHIIPGEGWQPTTTFKRLSTVTQTVFESMQKGTLHDKIVLVDRARDVKVIGILPVDGGDSYLVAAVFPADFDASLTTLLFYILIVLLLVVASLAFVGTLLARSIIRPIQKIQEGSERIGKGDFSHAIEVYTNDELENLSHSLTIASGKLKNSYAHLEEEIARRTQQLAEVNNKQKEQIQLLDKTSKQLVRRDFELQITNEKLRDIDRAKSQFVSIAAHQLRTPLSAVKWTCNMLLTEDFGKLKNEQAVAVERALGSINRLISLVGDLLNVARIEGGQFIYKFEPFGVEEIVQQVVHDMTSKAETKGVSLTLALPRQKLPQAHGDEEKLYLAFENIIENAILYTPQGGWVKVSIKGTAKHYSIRVSDNGAGIPKNEMSSLFQKFFRAKNVVRLRVEGTGLGLYITASVIEAHGGTIHVDSQENKGTTFTLTLPLLT